LKETIKTDNIEQIKADSEELSKKFYEITTKIYQQANPQGAQGAPNGDAGQQQAGGADDFNVVDENGNDVK